MASLSNDLVYFFSVSKHTLLFYPEKSGKSQLDNIDLFFTIRKYKADFLPAKNAKKMRGSAF